MFECACAALRRHECTITDIYPSSSTSTSTNSSIIFESSHLPPTHDVAESVVVGAGEVFEHGGGKGDLISVRIMIITTIRN